MKTSKIYSDSNDSNSETISNTMRLKSIYTIPNDLQLVQLNLNNDKELYGSDGKESVFIEILSGEGELRVLLKNPEIKQLTKNSTALIPNGVKWTLTLTQSKELAKGQSKRLSANLLFSKPVYPSDYVENY